MSKIYDVIILGAGPAGLSAGLYAGRYRLDTLILEKGSDGGQIAITNEIDNYPGQMMEGETGPSLVARMSQQSKKFGAERVADTIQSVELEGEVKKLIGTKGEYLARTLIITTGAYPRPIGCENEEKFMGKGISFCATCDGGFFEGLDVYVVGGGEAAVEEAIFLSKIAKHVTIIHRREELRATRFTQQRAMETPNLSFLWNTVVESVNSSDGDDGLLNTMVVKNVKTGEKTTIEADPADGLFGLFGFLGLVPKTDLFKGILDMDESGYLITDENMHTNIPGVYAAGDLRQKSFRQVVTAAADGAIAANQAEHYISKLTEI